MLRKDIAMADTKLTKNAVQPKDAPIDLESIQDTENNTAKSKLQRTKSSPRRIQFTECPEDST